MDMVAIAKELVKTAAFALPLDEKTRQGFIDGLSCSHAEALNIAIEMADGPEKLLLICAKQDQETCPMAKLFAAS